MGLTDQQKQAANAPGSVAVTAGAGTGKTHMLAERYLYFLQQGLSPLQLVAVTFTEKAAAELRSRIRRTITSNMGDRPDLLAELEAAQISTFHALAARICREHPDKAQVPPDFRVQDDIDSKIWQADALTEALAQLPPDLYSTIPFSLMQGTVTALLADPSTAEQALQRRRADWLPALAEFRQSYLENIASQPVWQAACQQLSMHIGPVHDKREQARQMALAAALAFASSLDVADLADLTDIGLRGGSKKQWPDPASFDVVKDEISSLKERAKKGLAVLQGLELNAYDDDTEAKLPAIRQAFALARAYLRSAKNQQRLLDFNDLEVQALQALQDSAVQAYYSQRWAVFLIDEFQDTNPIQGQFLRQLTANATLTIVGDVKQSIYGFRRADVRVFQEWQQRLHPPPDAPVELSLSFRTHKLLMAQINRVFAPVLGDLHQPLQAHRQEGLEPVPQMQLYQVVVSEAQKGNPAIDTSIDACRRVEAQKIADLVQDMLALPLLVHNKPTGKLRPIRPDDIAILARNWAPLELYGNAIAARNIPILQAGGGNLLGTREAKDAWSLLRFLADPSDSLALAAVLRGPFFAISDRPLYLFAQALPDHAAWWPHLKHSPQPDLRCAAEVLQQLLVARRTETPTRLLQLGDRLTGYTAVTANLPGATRRLADWSGFIELVRILEPDGYDVLAVVRRLKRLAAAAVDIPRPAVDGSSAVSLMTIHGSKGLEWPVVIVPDLSHALSRDSPTIRFDAALGIALKLEDDDREQQKSALYTLLEQRQRAGEQEEAKRILYVALTRARDRLLLTSASPAGGSLDLLQPGIEWLNPIAIPFDPDLAQPVAPVAPPIPTAPTHIMVHPTGSGLAELPVTALSDYALCPQRFKFRHIDGHPGYQTRDDSRPHAPHGMELGKLVHKALELGIHQVEILGKYAPHLSREAVQAALDLAQRFHQAEAYAAQRQGRLHWEQPVSCTIGSLTLNGVVDLVGDDFVLDFKTDAVMQPDHHQFQLWAYQKATEKPDAYLAYLRHDHLHRFDASQLSRLDQQATVLVQRLVGGDFAPHADHHRCGICPYGEICDSHMPPPS